MPLDHQQIISKLTWIRDGLVKGCECGGSGRITIKTAGIHGVTGQISHGEGEYACKKCKELRGLDFTTVTIKLPNPQLCPHDISTTGCMINECENCLEEKYVAPDLTTHRYGSKLWIVTVLETLGLLDEFLNDPHLTPMDLLDGELLVPAIGAYLEGRE